MVPMCTSGLQSMECAFLEKERKEERAERDRGSGKQQEEDEEAAAPKGNGIIDGTDVPVESGLNM
jgi:hypothetical protein